MSNEQTKRVLIVGDGTNFDRVKELVGLFREQRFLALTAVGSASASNRSSDDAAWHRRIMQRDIRNKRYEQVAISGSALSIDCADALTAAYDSGIRVVNHADRDSKLDLTVKEFEHKKSLTAAV